MFEVYVFNQEDANKMSALGFALVSTTTDINGKAVWQFVGDAKSANFEKMPQGAVVKNGFHINFVERRKGDG